MKQKILLSALLIIGVSTISGFVFSRRPQVMLKIHGKDLSKHGLTLVLPSDPDFANRFSAGIKDGSITNADTMNSMSVFLENRTKQTVVAYRILWCFTKPSGETNCTTKTVSAPRALMEGENLSPDVEAQTGKIRSASARLISLMSFANSGQPGMAVRVTPEEAEKIRQGVRPDPNTLRDRAMEQFGKYSDVTVSIDGAFFDDGTFVGPNTTQFFEEIAAHVKARRDLLEEVAGRANSKQSKEQVLQYLQSMADQDADSINPKSTPEDHYRYYQKFYAQRILRGGKQLGDEAAIAEELSSRNKSWHALTKRTEKNDR